MTSGVFLDRDGTLVEEVGYADRLQRLTLFPWSADAVRLLTRAGFPVVMVTNQSGVARGLFDEAFVADANAHLERVLAAGGGRIARSYYCPHHPDGAVAAYRTRCECRKPRPGMLHRAAGELELDLARSFVVGDRLLDMEMARAVGATGILVRTGAGEGEASRLGSGAAEVVVVANVIEAVTWILRRTASDGAGA